MKNLFLFGNELNLKFIFLNVNSKKMIILDFLYAIHQHFLMSLILIPLKFLPHLFFQKTQDPLPHILSHCTEDFSFLFLNKSASL